MTKTGALLTAEEFFWQGGDDRPSELVRGKVRSLEFPGGRHGMICANLIYELRSHVDRSQSGTAVALHGIITGRNPDTVRGADVSYYSYFRMPKGTIPIGYADVRPELVFEVQAHDEPWSDLTEKAAEFLQAGVEVVCLVDPSDETVTVYRTEGPSSAFRIHDTMTFPSILPGYSLPVCEIFRA